MDQVLRLDISFNKKQSVFLAGENVEGSIHFELRQELDVEECAVELIGQLNSRKSSFVSVVLPRVNRSIEDVVKSQQLLFSRRRILTGQMDLPFAFPLPMDCPQSLECWPLVQIRYFVKASVRFPENGNSELLEARRMFSVLEQGIPPAGSAARQSVREALLRPLRSPICSEDGFVEAQIGLKKNYYVPGEDVVISFLVDNQTPRILKRVTIDVRQVVRKTGTNPPSDQAPKKLVRSLLKRTVSQSIGIGQEDVGPVLPHSVAQQRRCKIHLPALPCSSSAVLAAGRRPIDVCYVAQLNVHLGLGQKRMLLECPFTVGSLPLRSALCGPDVIDSPLSSLSRPRPPLPSAYVESALGPVSYCSLSTLGHSSKRSQFHLMCSYTPYYFYFPTISCVPKPGTPSTLRSILKPRSLCSTLSAPSSIGFSDTASTTTNWSGNDSCPNIHFESPV